MQTRVQGPKRWTEHLGTQQVGTSCSESASYDAQGFQLAELHQTKNAACLAGPNRQSCAGAQYLEYMHQHVTDTTTVSR